MTCDFEDTNVNPCLSSLSFLEVITTVSSTTGSCDLAKPCKGRSTSHNLWFSLKSAISGLGIKKRTWSLAGSISDTPGPLQGAAAIAPTPSTHTAYGRKGTTHCNVNSAPGLSVNTSSSRHTSTGLKWEHRRKTRDLEKNMGCHSCSENTREAQ